MISAEETATHRSWSGELAAPNRDHIGSLELHLQTSDGTVSGTVTLNPDLCGVGGDIPISGSIADDGVLTLVETGQTARIEMGGAVTETGALLGDLSVTGDGCSSLATWQADARQ